MRRVDIKRVEQGVPLQTLDLRTCSLAHDYLAAVQSLSSIVPDTLVPEERGRVKTMTMWYRLLCDPFVDDITG